MNKEEIEKILYFLKRDGTVFIEDINKIETYINQIEQENKQYKTNLKEVHNRFENEKETLNDLLNYYPNFKIQFKYNDGKQKELDVVEKKYYKKLIDFIDKQNKIIDKMAEQLAGITIWNDEKGPLILMDKKQVKQYFKKKAKEE